MDYIFNVVGLEANANIDPSFLVPIILDQMQGYEEKCPGGNRYKVYVELFQGRQAPAKKLEDLVKITIDSLTQSMAFWSHSEQVDEIIIRKTNNPRLEKSNLRIQIRND
jgi:Holliday junction resolvase RusA-like endonuclease